jgi:hypothetical protein
MQRKGTQVDIIKNFIDWHSFKCLLEQNIGENPMLQTIEVNNLELFSKLQVQ